nr:FecR domain-containing protein [Govania unica]
MIGLFRKWSRPPRSAEDWIIRLHAPDCDAGDKQSFERWLAENPDHDVAFQRANKAWQMTRAFAADPVLHRMAHEARKEAQAAAEKKNSLSHQLRSVALVASLVVVALLYSLKPFAPDHYETGHGELRTITLADGSIVHLNTETRLTVVLNHDERRLTLNAGEAFFEVAHDASRPFLVNTGHEIVRAIGTKFSVHIDHDTTVVAVAEGRVGIRSMTTEAPLPDLFPGQQVRISAQGKLVSLRSEEADTVAAWRYGRIYFFNETLSNVLADVNRYATPKFEMVDPRQGEMRISGTFKTGDVAAVLFTLQDGMGFSAAQTDQVILLKKSKP